MFSKFKEPSVRRTSTTCFAPKTLLRPRRDQENELSTR